MSERLTAGMHDHPGVWPTLPPKEPHPLGMEPPDDIWRTCWEFVLTHELTDGEGSAFWHGADLMHKAMLAPTQPVERGDGDGGRA